MLLQFTRIIESMKLGVPLRAIEQLFKELDEDHTGEIVYEDFVRKLRGAPPGQLANQLAETTPARSAATARLRKASNVVRTVVSPLAKDSISRGTTTRRVLELDGGPLDNEESQHGALQDDLRILQLHYPKRVEHAQLQAQAAEYERRAVNAHWRRPGTAPALKTGPRSWPSYQRKLTRFGEYEELEERWKPVCHWRAPPANDNVEQSGKPIGPTEPLPDKARFNARFETTFEMLDAPPGCSFQPIFKEALFAAGASNSRVAEILLAGSADLATHEHHAMPRRQSKSVSVTNTIVSDDLRERRRNGEATLLYSEWLQLTDRTERARGRFWPRIEAAGTRKMAKHRQDEFLPHLELDKRKS